MVGCSRIINIVVTLTIFVLFTLGLWATNVVYSTVEVIKDRENAKAWMRDPQIQEQFVMYITNQTYAEGSEALKKIVDKEEYEGLVKKQLSEERLNSLSERSVDQIYDWLEGKEDMPAFSLLGEDGEAPELKFISEQLGSRLGDLSEVIDEEDLLFISDQLNLVNSTNLSLEKLPESYQTLLRLPLKIGISTAVLGVVLILSLRSWRWGVMAISLALVAVGSWFLFGVVREQIMELVSYEQLAGKYIPEWFGTLPNFLKSVGEKALEQINTLTHRHALWGTVAGVVGIVISQIAIREREEEIESAAEKYYVG